MSHWQSGKVELKCSLELLLKALKDVKPEWNSHIHSSKEAKFEIFGYDGQMDSQRHNVLVAGSKNPNYPAAPDNVYGDLGLYKEPDNTWSIKGDFSGILGVNDFEGALKASIAALKVKKIASMENNKETADFQKGKKRVIRMVVPVDQQYKI